jgi:hypothetical protein
MNNMTIIYLPSDYSEVRRKKWFRLTDCKIEDLSSIDMVLIDEQNEYCYNPYLYFLDEEMMAMPVLNK